MTLPSSGTITLKEIISEFSGPNYLTAYYRGGTYVPDVSQNDNIPTSGKITLTDFYGATSAQVVITSAVYTVGVVDPNNAATEVQFCANGSLQVTYTRGDTPTTNNISGQWLVGGSSDSYQIYAQLHTQNNSGTVDNTGTFNTWLNCNTSPEWSVFAAQNNGIANSNIFFTIRQTNGSNVASAYIDIQALAIYIGGG